MLFDKKDPLSRLTPKPTKEKKNKTPNYTSAGRVVRRGLSRRNKVILAVCCVVLVFGAIAGVIYLPQFKKVPVSNGYPIAATNATAWSALQSYLAAHPDEDFDGDGLTNAEELTSKTDPYFQDSDFDGVMDKQDTKPMSKGNAVLNTMKASGEDIDTPVAMNGVILWPDDNKSWARGGVIKVQTGYQFTNYKGWAKFQTGGIAYQYVDGRHTPLSYRKDIDAYYIEQDCLVVLEKTEKEMTYLISFFGHHSYMRGKLGKFLASALPDRGWITGRAMWLDDTFIDVGVNTKLPCVPLDITTEDESRFAFYSSDLMDLSNTYAWIDAGYYVFASLISEDMGEMIVAVYGYTYDGNLLVMNPATGSSKSVLIITAHCGRCLTPDNKVSQFSYFAFRGCGYSSADGDMISFFSAIPSQQSKEES